jgi:DNA repair protein RadC
VIFVHNHPSGDPRPSMADVAVTRKMKEAGELLQIEVLDHVILGAPRAGAEKNYCSLREEGGL